jgi:hypothetical protein
VTREDVSTGLQDHLDGGATTLAWCWKVERRDGTVLGFTDHDLDLSFDGVSFAAATGFTASEVVSSLGLAVDNLEVEGALAAAAITEADLAAGLYDGATVELWRVNWADAAQRVLMRKGALGEVSRGELAFTAELRGLAHALQQATGRTYQRLCDADLGDARCGVDIDAPEFKGTGSVDAVSDDRMLTVSGLGGFRQQLVPVRQACLDQRRQCRPHRRGQGPRQGIDGDAHAVAARAVAGRTRRRIHRDGRLRQDAGHLQGQVRQHRELPRLPAHAGQRPRLRLCGRRVGRERWRKLLQLSGEPYAIVAEARSWIGTPYHHQASVKHVGCDCLGLVRGVWRALLGPEPEPDPRLLPRLGRGRRQETMLAAARRHLIEIDARRGPARRRAGVPDAAPAGWPSTPGSWRTASLPDPASSMPRRAGRSARWRSRPWWRARIAAAFAFPNS